MSSAEADESGASGAGGRGVLRHAEFALRSGGYGRGAGVLKNRVRKFKTKCIGSAGRGDRLYPLTTFTQPSFTPKTFALAAE